MRLRIVLILTLSALSFNQVVFAVCDEAAERGQRTIGRYQLLPGFGASIYGKAEVRADELDCVDYKTDVVSDEVRMTGLDKQHYDRSVTGMKHFYRSGFGDYSIETSARVIVGASIPQLLTEAYVGEIGTSYTNTIAQAEIADVVTFYNPYKGEEEVTTIPVQFCSQMTTEIENKETSLGFARSFISYSKYVVGGEPKASDSFDIPDTDITFYSPGQEKCLDGEITMSGNYAGFSFRLKSWTTGLAAQEDIFIGLDINGDPVYHKINLSNAGVKGWLKFGPLPDNTICYSGSGSVPGCMPCRGQTYGLGQDTIEEAALEAIARAFQQPDVDDYEYAGTIFPVCEPGSVDLKFLYTFKRHGTHSANLMASDSDAAGWHTHPEALKKLSFCIYWFEGDCAWVSDNNLPLYLGYKEYDLIGEGYVVKVLYPDGIRYGVPTLGDHVATIKPSQP